MDRQVARLPIAKSDVFVKLDVACVPETHELPSVECAAAALATPPKTGAEKCRTGVHTQSSSNARQAPWRGGRKILGVVRLF